MTETDPRICALLGSRICHDLVSPLGAISNGVELLQMSGMGNSPELMLITESVENANARIRLFRVAFGAASPEQRIARAELTEILRPIGQGRKIEIDWALPADMPRDTARLVLLLLLCCETVLPFGGQVAVETEAQRIAIVVTAERLRDLPDLWQQATGESNEMPQASEIHFPLAAHAAAEMGARISVMQEEGRIAISA
ncbi:histidine phosphotransferase family protein [Palleronia sp. LCG004]|uniref:histidine phosphotransferase family protein n=1 Tax=Palleronia sp. LCG004 TaxID=3079304 RepID=UPI0029421786|nr:histidine phosphotransferase family protein [Palleronia sp. LCG004]WOI56991.1 histidine phosphotransferase family protein [Palleronia sp. LCG004]